MNNRDYKEFAPNAYYHIFNRGNGKQNIFHDRLDYELFLSRLEENIFPSTFLLKKQVVKNEEKSNTHTPYIRQILPDN